MIKEPIYKPKGKAGEYCEWAANIYTGCNHGCKYCYALRILRKTREQFEQIEPRRDIVESVKAQLWRWGGLTPRIIQLCFTCDPYPADIDTTATREIIKAIKESGHNVQILTKGGFRAVRDFDLLGDGDWFGVTLTDWNSGSDREPKAAAHDERIGTLLAAKKTGAKTWVSFEPVYNPIMVYQHIRNTNAIDRYKIGKLNYAPSDIDWGEFGRECERLCIKHGRDYYIKQALRDLM